MKTARWEAARLASLTAHGMLGAGEFIVVVG